jgi:uncharacterized protein
VVGRVAIWTAMVLTASVACATDGLLADLAFIELHSPLEPNAAQRSTPLVAAETSDLKMAVATSIRLYQVLVSSQDAPVCNFTPSCSRFGLTAYRRLGLVYGKLLTFDRLQRCHGMGGAHYPTDPGSGLSHDPVRIYEILLNIK